MKTQATETTATKWIAYYRVSTQKQGLGLEAQRARVHQAAQEQGAIILDEIEEKESGKEKETELSHRQGLNKALARARKHGAIIVVAKHDRLSRDLAFAAHLVFKTGIGFKVLNVPDEALTDPLLFGVYWGLADKEARLISERTKEALAKLKDQGVKLGNPNGATALLTDEAKARATEVKNRKAQENPNNVKAANEIRRFIANGKKSLREIARHLTENGFLTSRGLEEHTAKSVQLLCKRFEIAL